MNKTLIVCTTIVALIAICSAVPAVDRVDYRNYNSNNNGKYINKNFKDGQYHRSLNNEGRSGVYYDSNGRYMHVHDNRELGFYVHIPYPYDGGYGPYSGSNIPYVHDDRPYDHNLYTTTTTKKPTTTTKRTTTTTTTTTTTPRPILFNYDDEGRHKILHQEHERKNDKYDHAYLTENGIYGEEQAKLHHEGGTHAMGYYEYTGDDGKLYRVNYKSNNGGFMPMGDHIPTPPPIPEAIQRALKYVDERLKANGHKSMFDQRGFRIDHMSKDEMLKLKSLHLDTMISDVPNDLKEGIMKLEHELKEQEKNEQMQELKHNEEHNQLSQTTSAEMPIPENANESYEQDGNEITDTNENIHNDDPQDESMMGSNQLYDILYV